MGAIYTPANNQPEKRGAYCGRDTGTDDRPHEAQDDKAGHSYRVVLDEADEMLNMGILEDIETILEATSVNRQTLLFSATMPESIRRLPENIRRIHRS